MTLEIGLRENIKAISKFPFAFVLRQRTPELPATRICENRQKTPKSPSRKLAKDRNSHRKSVKSNNLVAIASLDKRSVVIEFCIIKDSYILRGRVNIRAEDEVDWTAVKAVNEAAFETSAEARLVAVLREEVQPVVSLVGEDGGLIVGHIMFSPVLLRGHPELKIIGLGPMAVVPSHQRRGIGAELVRAGIEECKKLGFGAVVVLGHAEYYPRFGFSPAARFGIGCDYDAPEEAFMLIELEPGYLHGVTGKIKYHAAFNNV